MMRETVLSALLLLCISAAAWGAGEGGADYGYPFAAGSIVNQAGAVNPLATATVVEWTGEDLIAVGAETAADALALAAGAFAYHADRWPERGERLLRVRGAGPQGIKVLVDGVPYDQGLFGTTNLAEIPADQIARLRVYPGPAPAIFGAEGGAGVVEIVTRRAGEDFVAGFDGRFGDHRRNLFSFGLGDTESGFQYFGMASHHSADGEPLPLDFARTRVEEGGLRNGTEFARDHYRARVGAALENLVQAHASIFYDVDDRQVPDDAVLPSAEFHRFPRLQRLGGGLNTQLGAYGPFHLDGEAYLVDFSETRNDYRNADFSDLVRQRRYRDVRAGGGATPWLDFGAYSRVTLRFEGRRDDIEFWVQDHPRTQFQMRRLGGSAIEELNPISWLNVSLGGGGTNVDPLRADTLTPEGALSAPHARAGLAFGPFAGVTIRAAAGRYPEFPTVEELFDANLGDPTLQPGTFDCVELAVDSRAPGDSLFSLAGFWRRERDAIDLVREPGRDWPIFTNTADRQARGVTLTASSRPVTGLYLGASGTYLSFYDDNAGEIVRLTYVPRWSGSLDARYRFSFGFGMAAQLYAAGERRDVVGGETIDLTPYSLAALRLFYSYRDKIEIYVQGRNLLDVAYETKREYPEPGRVVVGGVKLTY
jgi:hypothetical protein